MRSIIDQRPIMSISMGEGGGTYSVGIRPHEPEYIEPYEENGEMAPVTWFRGVREGRTLFRLNGKFVLHIDYRV